MIDNNIGKVKIFKKLYNIMISLNKEKMIIIIII